MKNQTVNRNPIICPRSRTNAPKPARNQLIPAVNSTWGISSAGSQRDGERDGVADGQQETAIEEYGE
jgi:hypothetical protein